MSHQITTSSVVQTTYSLNNQSLSQQSILQTFLRSKQHIIQSNKNYLYNVNEIQTLINSNFQETNDIITQVLKQPTNEKLLRLQHLSKNLQSKIQELIGITKNEKGIVQQINLIESMEIQINKLNISILNNEKKIQDFLNNQNIMSQNLKIKNKKLQNQTLRNNQLLEYLNLIQKNVNEHTHLKQLKSIIFLNMDPIQKYPVIPIEQFKKYQIFVNKLLIQIKFLTQRFPVLKKDLKARSLYDILEKQNTDFSDFDKIIQIVKFIPNVIYDQTMKITGSQKREQFLILLLKKMFQEIEQIKKINPQFIFKFMNHQLYKQIQSEIQLLNSVEDLYLFQLGRTKTIQIQSIKEKIVEKPVEVIKHIYIKQNIPIPIEVEKIKEIEKLVHVPFQVLVEVPIIRQKVIQVPVIKQVIKQVPTIIQIPMKETINTTSIIYQQKIVEVPIIKQVPVQIIQQKYIYVTVIQEVLKIIEKAVPIEIVVQKIRQIPIIIQKIIPLKETIRYPVEITNYIQKLIVNTKYNEINTVTPKIIKQPQIIKFTEQIIVPIERTIQIPKIIQKIIEKVEVVQVLVEKIKEVQVIKQRVIIQQVPLYIQKQVLKYITLIKQIPKEIQKVVEIPIIHEKLKIQYIQVPKVYIQTITKQIVKKVEVQIEKVIKQPKFIQLEKHFNHYFVTEKPKQIIKEVIVEVPKIVRFETQKIIRVPQFIEKIVEVPTIKEVEKIVEKIVVVPRIVQQFIEVEKIITEYIERQVIIYRDIIKQIQVPIQIPYLIIKQIQKIVEKVVIKEVPVEVLKQIIVQREVTKEKIKQVQTIITKPIEVLLEVEKQILVEKIVPLIHQTEKIVEIPTNKFIQIFVEKPVQICVQKIVPLLKVETNVITIPQRIQVINIIKEKIETIKEIATYIEKPVEIVRIEEVQKIILQIQQVIRQVPILEHLQIPIISTRQIPVEVRVQHEKIIFKQINQFQPICLTELLLVTIPQMIPLEIPIYKYIKEPSLIQITKNNFIEIPKYIQTTVRLENVKQKIHEKKVTETIYETIYETIQKCYPIRQVQIIQNYLNHIIKQIEIKHVEKIVQNPSITSEIIIKQVPVIVQKILQKIYLIPEVLEILKKPSQILHSDAETKKKDTEQIYSIVRSAQNQTKTEFKLLINQLNQQNKIIQNLQTELQLKASELEKLKFIQEKYNLSISQKSQVSELHKPYQSQISKQTTLKKEQKLTSESAITPTKSKQQQPKVTEFDSEDTPK